MNTTRTNRPLARGVAYTALLAAPLWAIAALTAWAALR